MAGDDWRMSVERWAGSASLLRASPGRASRGDHGWQGFWRSFRSAGGSQSLACSDCSAAPSLHRRDVAAAGRPFPRLLISSRHQHSVGANQV